MSKVLALDQGPWLSKCENFFQKPIFMSDVSGFTKTKAKKMPNRWHQNFGSELYGFGMFVKRNIIIVSVRTQILAENFHRKLGPLKVPH